MAISRRTRSVLVGTGVLVIVAALVIGVAVGVSRGPAAGTRAILGRPAAFQLTYRVVTDASGQPSTAFEVLTVHRPFDSSDITYPLDPRTHPGQVPQKATWFSADALFTIDTAGVVRRVAGRQPGPPGSDQALGVELDALVARGLARPLHVTQHLAGRACAVYRFLEPPAGAIRPLTAGQGHDDLCLDADGLELSERWVLGGRAVYTRTAVAVTVGPVTDPMTPAGAQPLPGNAPAASVTPGPAADAPIATPPTPAGFRLARTEQFTLPDPTGAGVEAQSSVWAFVRGPDTITVEAGRERGGALPWADQPTVTAPVRLAHLTGASSALRSDGPEIRIPLPGGAWVRVHGTVPLAELVSYARTLPAPR